MDSVNLTNRFEEIFRRLLDREGFEGCEQELSAIFEVVATNLLSDFPERKGCYFDGVVGLSSKTISSREVEFLGEMWIGRNQSQWTEDFQASVIDKSISKEGTWITMRVGSDRATGKLSSCLKGS